MDLEESLQKADSHDRVLLLDENFPNLDDYTNTMYTQLPASIFDTQVQKTLLLNDEEIIFLTMQALIGQAPRNPGFLDISTVLFTNEKLLIISDFAQTLFDFAYLNTLSFENKEHANIIEEQFQKVLKLRSKKKKQFTIHPINYDVIYDLRIQLTEGSVVNKENKNVKALFPEILHKRSDRSPSNDYFISIVHVGTGFPWKESLEFKKESIFSRKKHVEIKKRGDPKFQVISARMQAFRDQFKKELIKKGVDDIKYVYFFETKQILDALRRVHACT